LEGTRSCEEHERCDRLSLCLRNAGRKKSHPVWGFFKDLRNSEGMGGVFCEHCAWESDDRSPNNLKAHLKQCHLSDGVYKQFSDKLASRGTGISWKSLSLCGVWALDAVSNDSCEIAFCLCCAFGA
uniref:BED-type domain-containing protein n=1 Tax=Gongylonema pulchrum TaxID=637853 RepID=A0A183EP14_9BILA